MKILEVLRIRQYFLIAAVSAVLFGLFYIYTQVLGILQNIDVWLSVTSPINMTLFIVISILFGTALSFQIYNWRQPKTCPIDMKAKGAGTSGSATVIGLFIAQCPACASLGALLLPASVLTFFVKYSTALNFVTIGLLLFTINYLGGFKKA